MSVRFGVFVDGRLIGEGYDTKEEAEREAQGVRDAFPAVKVEVDTIHRDEAES